MAEKQIMVKIDHVSKEYRLGAIGGTTLREDLERFRAKIRKKEDPYIFHIALNQHRDLNIKMEHGEAFSIFIMVLIPLRQREIWKAVLV